MKRYCAHKNALIGAAFAVLFIAPITLHQFIPYTRQVDASGSTEEMMRVVANSSNTFGIDLYREIQDGASNVFFSPWSITSAMLMLQEGARNQTAAEIADVFHLGDMETWRPNYAGIHNRLVGGERFTLRTANALWADQSHAFNAEYIGIIDRYYGGGTRYMDFANSPDTACQEINDWVADITNDRIRDLLQPGDVSPLTRLVITNAIYFNSAWKYQFKPDQTTNRTFYSPSGSQSIPFMHLGESDLYFNYMENNLLQMLELPYTGDRLSMLLLLPRVNVTLVDFVEQHLSTAALDAWKAEMAQEEVEINVPTFDIETRYDLIPVLEALGMSKAFSPSEADFSGLDGTRDLSVSSIVHQAFVAVNEVGTEAAAATAIVVWLTAIGYDHIFLANRPFIFLIQERTTGAILFMGSFTDPSS
nr:serpin family protein [Candidatus Sigynarchaeota archaeon]